MFVNQANDAYDRMTEQYVVAYLDILGITSRIKQRDDDVLSMNKLHNLYVFSMELVRELNIAGSEDIKFKIFSDNIMIAKKTTEKTLRDDIYCILACVGHFQELAAGDSVGWLLRGGITIGSLFMDEIMVWGKALLRSYELENRIAIYPRVIIDDNIIENISPEDPSRDFIRYDNDGMAFLNYLHHCNFVDETLMRGFERMKKEAGAHPDARVLQKLMWHKNFVNRELDAKGQNRFRLSMADSGGGRQ